MKLPKFLKRVLKKAIMTLLDVFVKEVEKEIDEDKKDK